MPTAYFMIDFERLSSDANVKFAVAWAAHPLALSPTLGALVGTLENRISVSGNVNIGEKIQVDFTPSKGACVFKVQKLMDGTERKTR
jgi:hypothetical protein